MACTVQKYLLLLLLALLSAGAFAQISSERADYTDSTKYRRPLPSDTTRYTPLSRTQDKIFVFFEKWGTLEAKQPVGRVRHFTWYKLDTASRQFNQQLFADTAEISEAISSVTFPQLVRDSSRCTLPTQQFTYTSENKTSTLPDSLGYGCYRVITDTLQTVYDTLRCDSFCYEKIVRYDTLQSFTGGDSIVERRDTLYADTTLYIPKSYRIVPADTFNAWVILDTFRIDTIIKVSQSCEFLNLEPLFYPNAEQPDVLFLYFSYKYVDLWQPRRVEREFPDLSGVECGNNPLCYIKKVEWTTSVDIYKGVAVEDVNEEWKTRILPPIAITSPYYNASYKLEVSNYFGNVDTMSTGVIEAMATYAKMKLYVEKADDNGVKDFEEKTGEDNEESPAVVKLVNASINSNNPLSHPDSVSIFTWSLFSNLYEQPEDELQNDSVQGNEIPENLPLITPPIITYDSATEVFPIDYNSKLYQPGRYPITLHVKNAQGCISADTMFLEVDEFLLNKDAIPTVFTPNNDGKNDVFALRDPEGNTQSLQSIEINVMNRYGQLMFSSSGDINFSWDGKMRNTNATAPDGVYFYVLKATGLNKQRKTVNETHKGYLHLFGGE
ncbi:MAG: gliding motility-associated C-terminal domain-containing protein [Prevotellaceae bacterium]|jgi:gliding motility-associated-like protein|nr:gliding motility-associated C-terminal domain-containing protein [Prevotellaceae bacterium]